MDKLHTSIDSVMESTGDVERSFIVNPFMDIDLFIKANNCPRISNPILFSSPGIPTEDGLLSYELFGTNPKDRSNIFGYIELNGVYLHPLAYKIWSKLDRKIPEIIWSEETYSINSKGEIVLDPEGTESGIEFLKNNFDKIKFKDTGSNKRNVNISILKKNKDKIFITRCIVSPPYIRDILVSQGKTEVGELNKFYQKLISNANSMETLNKYGMSIDHVLRGTIQETLVNIYNWTSNEPNLGKKRGTIRRSVLSKTTDYASRLVMSAPDLNVESPKDFMTDIDHCTIPLASLCGNIKPFLLHYLRNTFNNIFSGTGVLVTMADDNKIGERITIEDFEDQFNDERYDREIESFIHGYSNRFAPITYKYNNKVYTFKINRAGELRPITWCELFYMGVYELTLGKCALITRFPVDSYYSQFPNKIRGISTIECEEVTIGNTTYPNYPKIRLKDIGTDTSNKFRDTANIFNPYLGAIGGDYDGDQIKTSVAFSDEANAELNEHLNSKVNFINLGCEPIRKSSNEAIQCLYNLTLFLPEDNNKLGKPTF